MSGLELCLLDDELLAVVLPRLLEVAEETVDDPAVLMSEQLSASGWGGAATAEASGRGAASERRWAQGSRAATEGDGDNWSTWFGGPGWNHCSRCGVANPVLRRESEGRGRSDLGWGGSVSMDSAVSTGPFPPCRAGLGGPPSAHPEQRKVPSLSWGPATPPPGLPWILSVSMGSVPFPWSKREVAGVALPLQEQETHL